MGKINLLPTEYGAFRGEIRSYFIENVLPNAQSILDPWAGTAPFIPILEASRKRTHLNDLLPVHSIINQAKIPPVASAVLHSEFSDPRATLKFLVHSLRELDKRKLTISSEWFDEDILKILQSTWFSFDKLELNLQRYFKAILLASVRPFSCFSTSHNPTWLKRGGMSSGEDVSQVLQKPINSFLRFLKESYPTPNSNDVSYCTFYASDSEFLEINDLVDTIFTSPPYCNRLDIYRMYQPELYFLHSIGYMFDPSRILGTNIISDYTYREDLDYIRSVSPRTFTFLERVEKIGKLRESAYYLRYFSKYFAKLFRSITNLLRFLRPGGVFYLVVQNNAHRGECVSIGEFLIDFFTQLNTNSRIILERLCNHLGKKNISSEYPVVYKKHTECIVGAFKC